MQATSIFVLSAVMGIVASGTQPVAAIGISPNSTISIQGAVDFVGPAADPNLFGIEVGDTFSIEAMYNSVLLANIGLETLTPDIDASLSFELRIGRGPAVVWDEEDDLIFPFGPLINFNDGAFDSFLFQSNDFAFASDAFVQVIDRVEILDSETFDTLVTGEFRQVEISPD